MTRSVLFVCLGNICRSPAAEAAVRNIAPQWVLDSAGTGAWHIGEAPYAPMQSAARARGLDMSDLRARQFHRDDFARFDLIIAMDQNNLAEIEHQRPAGNQTPVALFTEFCSTKETAIPDPYYSRDFDGALDLVMECALGLAASLD